MSQNFLTQGILTKQDIETEIDNGSLILHASKNQIQACSYDLRIGTIFRNGNIIKDQTVQVDPGGIISMFTEEELKIPDNMMATVFAINGKSSEGLLVLNPGHIDPGFQGHLTVQAINLQKTQLAIAKGEPIFTIIFQRLPNSTTSPYRNVPRDDRERNFNSSIVGKIPKHIGELMLGETSPLVTKQNFQTLLIKHWFSWLPMVLSVIGLTIALVAIAPNNKANNPSNSSVNVEQVNC